MVFLIVSYVWRTFRHTLTLPTMTSTGISSNSEPMNVDDFETNTDYHLEIKER
jgi:hypothetical protein